MDRRPGCSRLCIVINPSFALHTCYGEFYSYLGALGYQVSAIAGVGEDDHAIARSFGVRTFAIPIERYPSPVRDLQSLFRIWKVFRHEKFDVVQVSTPKASLLGLVAARLAGQRRIMYLVRGRAYECKRGLARWVYSRIDALCCHLADIVVPVSASLRDELVRESICPVNKIRMIGSGSSKGIDVEAFAPTSLRLSAAVDWRRRLGIGDDATLVLFVGWIRREKGICELVSAIQSLQREGLDLHLLVLGDYHEPDDLDRATRTALDGEPGIHRIGWTSDVSSLYLAADVVALPSWREGLPRVLLEAAAAGKPVVATDVTGCRDAVVPNETGLLVPVCDPVALGSAIRRLAQDESLRSVLGDAGSQRVRELFDQARVWAGTEQLFCELANRTSE